MEIIDNFAIIIISSKYMMNFRGENASFSRKLGCICLFLWGFLENFFQKGGIFLFFALLYEGKILNSCKNTGDGCLVSWPTSDEYWCLGPRLCTVQARAAQCGTVGLSSQQVAEQFRRVHCLLFNLQQQQCVVPSLTNHPRKCWVPGKLSGNTRNSHSEKKWDD